MPVFEVSTRIAQSPAPPRKRTRRFPSQSYVVMRIVGGVAIAGLLFTSLTLFHLSDIIFILLPVFLSLATGQAQGYNLKKLLNSTPAYLTLTICLTFIYFALATAIVLFIHQNTISHIVLITTTLAWVVILEPLRIYIQQLIEQRFNLRNREAAKAIEAFTATLRKEIDLDQLHDRFLTFIQYTIRPYSVSFWVRSANEQREQSDATKQISIANSDPFMLYALSHTGAVEVERLQINSPIVQSLQANAVEMTLLLVSQGELIGLLALGPRLNGEEYTREDRALLNMLADQVAPALSVAQMVRAQQVQVRERERFEQELRTAQAIQHAFLPKDVPALAGWHIAPYYQSAREVGGDFYDFLPFEDGRLGLVIGDVTDKGIPAALVMMATRTMLRTAARQSASPGEVLAQVNDLLFAEIPAKMFVTCFYAILDPSSGRIRYANAGHDLPYRRAKDGVSELRATGMPLGLMPGMSYEEREVMIAPGETVLFYTDGLVEAHNPGHEMFSFPRLKTVLQQHSSDADGAALIGILLNELKNFTGKGWEQEDDVTLLTLQRAPAALEAITA